MAIAHLSVRPHTRSRGHSVAAGLAYRMRCALTDSRTGKRHDYSRGEAPVAAGYAYGTTAPAWTADDPQEWADAIEAAERRKNSMVSRDVEISLPHEFSDDQRERIAAEWAQWLASRYDAPVAWSIHAPSAHGDDRNHHVHCLMSTRSLGPGGIPDKKIRSLHGADGPSEIKAIRAAWEERCNVALAAAGKDDRIDMGATARLEGRETVHLGASSVGIERHARDLRDDDATPSARCEGTPGRGRQEVEVMLEDNRDLPEEQPVTARGRRVRKSLEERRAARAAREAERPRKRRRRVRDRKPDVAAEHASPADHHGPDPAAMVATPAIVGSVDELEVPSVPSVPAVGAGHVPNALPALPASGRRRRRRREAAPGLRRVSIPAAMQSPAPLRTSSTRSTRRRGGRRGQTHEEVKIMTVPTVAPRPASPPPAPIPLANDAGLIRRSMRWILCGAAERLRRAGVRIDQEGARRAAIAARATIAPASPPAGPVELPQPVRGLGDYLPRRKRGAGGRIEYVHRDTPGRIAFSDAGNRIELVEESGAAILAGLQLAAQKWGEGPGIQLHGGDAEYRARVVRLAAAHDIAITNLADEIAAERRRLEAARRAQEQRAGADPAVFSAAPESGGGEEATQGGRDPTRRLWDGWKAVPGPDGTVGLYQIIRGPDGRLWEEDRGLVANRAEAAYQLSQVCGGAPGDFVDAIQAQLEREGVPAQTPDQKILQGVIRRDASLLEQGLAEGGDPNQRIDGEPLLAVAVRIADRTGDPRSVELLLRRLPGAAVAGSDGEAAMNVAAATGDVGMIDLLRRHGAPAGRRNAAGELPTEVARKSGHADAAERLERMAEAEGAGPAAPAASGGGEAAPRPEESAGATPERPGPTPLESVPGRPGVMRMDAAMRELFAAADREAAAEAAAGAWTARRGEGGGIEAVQRVGDQDVTIARGATIGEVAEAVARLHGGSPGDAATRIHRDLEAAARRRDRDDGHGR